MPTYSTRRIKRLLKEAETAATADARGDKLESLIVYLLSSIPGVSLIERNVLDAPRAHEIDVALWNVQGQSQLVFLDPVTFVECKCTGEPVGSAEVGWFVRKLQDRGASAGILVALSGITGQAGGAANAHSEILGALVRDKIKILLLSRDELMSVRTTDQLIDLLKAKYSHLVLRRAVQ